SRIIADLETASPEFAPLDSVAGSPASNAGELVVLFGTESGNAETIADLLVTRLSGVLEVRASDLTDATIEDFRPENLVLIACSTHGEGDMPSSAKPFAALLDDERPDLTGARYAMFGLGDSSYEFYSRG